MISEQLDLIKRNTRTQVSINKTEMYFVDRDISTELLFEFIKLRSKYLKFDKLDFDRHSLSNREEKVFNLKFKEFLLSLIDHMNDDGIEYVLEFLVRVYSIDTFNPNELIFLLIPFDKYALHIKKLIKYKKTDFQSLESNSVADLASFFTKNYVNFTYLVKYYKAYPVLTDFLDSILEKIFNLLKHSNKNYLSEFSVIFDYLLMFNQEDKIRKYYKNNLNYFNCSDFNEYMKSIFPKIDSE